MLKNVKLFISAFKVGKANINKIDAAVMKYVPKDQSLIEAIRGDRRLKDETRKAYAQIRAGVPILDPLTAHSIARQTAWSIINPEAFEKYVADLKRIANETD